MPEHPDDPGRYGASFADVYDRWYPGGDEAEICRYLGSEVKPAARILELGVGTGRVALPLAAAGFEVVGLDASGEMLAALSAKDPARAVTTVRADAGTPRTWADAGVVGRFDCVLAACNLLLNLTAPGAQQSCISGAARLLAPGGILVTELSRIRLPEDPAEQVEVSTVCSDSTVMIATGAGERAGLVDGRHFEIQDGEPVRVRPWSIRVIGDGELERWCAGAGLRPRSRHSSWERSPCSPVDAVTVAVHERPDS